MNTTVTVDGIDGVLQRRDGPRAENDWSYTKLATGSAVMGLQCISILGSWHCFWIWQRFKYIFDPCSGTASNVHPTFLSDSLHVVCIRCWPRQLFEKLVETANSSSRLAAENTISHLRVSYWVASIRLNIINSYILTFFQILYNVAVRLRES